MWVYRIRIDKKRYEYYFKTKEECVAARLKALTEVYGEYMHSSDKAKLQKPPVEPVIEPTVEPDTLVA